MARSRDLWLSAGASLVAVGCALALAPLGWSLAWVCAVGVLAVGCLVAAARDWPFPFAVERSAGDVRDGLAWASPPTERWVYRAELDEVIGKLTRAGSGAVTLTTGLRGAGGFGKTMLAARACRDRAVLRCFPGGVYWVPVGRDMDGPRLAQKISQVVRDLGGGGAAFTSLDEAGRALTLALAGRRRVLLVADDIWTADQLAPFKMAGQAGPVLITYRRPGVLAGSEAQSVKVDAVGEEVARQILTRDLPLLPSEAVDELLKAGRAP